MAEKIVATGQESCNLNFLTAQKMIHRLLTHDRIKTALDAGRVINYALLGTKPEVIIKALTKEELAEKLGISVGEFNKLKCPGFYKEIVNKISLPLVQLYCATKFADGEYKGK